MAKSKICADLDPRKIREKKQNGCSIGSIRKKFVVEILQKDERCLRVAWTEQTHSSVQGHHL